MVQQYLIRSNYGTSSNYGTPCFFVSECVNLFDDTDTVKILTHQNYFEMI